MRAGLTNHILPFCRHNIISLSTKSSSVGINTMISPISQFSELYTFISTFIPLSKSRTFFLLSHSSSRERPTEDVRPNLFLITIAHFTISFPHPPAHTPYNNSALPEDCGEHIFKGFQPVFVHYKCALRIRIPGIWVFRSVAAFG